MATYAHDRAWSDQFIPVISRLIGHLLLVPADLERDTKEATDLMVLRARDMTIACRVRRPGFADRYPWEVTFRSRRDSGAETELNKMTDGWGDWFFYGHAGDTIEITRWFLLDLSAWRSQMIREVKYLERGEKQLLHGEKSNRGDGTHFKWFDVRSFAPQPRVIIASSHDIEPIARQSVPAQQQELRFA